MLSRINTVNLFPNSCSKSNNLNFKAFNADLELKFANLITASNHIEKSDLIHKISLLARAAEMEGKSQIIDRLFTYARQNKDLLPRVIYEVRDIAEQSDNWHLREITLEKLYPFLKDKDHSIVGAALMAVERVTQCIPHKTNETLKNLYPLLDSPIKVGERFYIREYTADVIGKIASRSYISKKEPKEQLKLRIPLNKSNPDVVRYIKSALADLS